MQKPQLYMFYIGGSAGKSNIEVHDIQFVVGQSPEDCYETLKAVWFGTPESLHIDGYKAVTWADGYSISVETTPPTESADSVSLFFVNAGGYQNDTLAEYHQFDLFVAKDAKTAKQKALKVLLAGFELQHKDDLIEVDNCLALKQVNHYFIHLTANPTGKTDLPLFQGYLPIGK